MISSVIYTNTTGVLQQYNKSVTTSVTTRVLLHVWDTVQHTSSSNSLHKLIGANGYSYRELGLNVYLLILRRNKDKVLKQ